MVEDVTDECICKVYTQSQYNEHVMCNTHTTYSEHDACNIQPAANRPT